MTTPYTRGASGESTAGRTRRGLTQAGVAVVLLLIGLAALTTVYLDTSQTASSSVDAQNSRINALQAQVQRLTLQQAALNGTLKNLAKALPSVDQPPTLRVITVEWAEFLSEQDRFFTNFIIVNQGDTVDLTYISNDTASHTFTIDAPYDFQINGSIAGTVNDVTGKVFNDTFPKNNSPGVTVGGTSGNVTGHGSFVAKHSGIYLYYCIYHIHLGMFGYLVVLPNSAYSGQSTTTTTTSQTVSGTHVGIGAGAGSYTNPVGFAPRTITVVIGLNNTVTWTNDDTITHTVTSLTGVFKSPNIEPGGRYSFTFTTPGNYSYGCVFHPFMDGNVVVKAAP
ncbi:MAG: cupredoxin domain-containing protein [archaeon]|nr:MAG: cupredoxin domain-containing protein [archaeon]